MILKYFEINKINLDINKIILLHGNNSAQKNEFKTELSKKVLKKEINSYTEKDIFENQENFYNNIYSNSLFIKNKIIFINQVSEKIFSIIKNISEKNLSNIFIVLDSENLDKKSKTRSLFEKDQRFISIPFYPDTIENLIKLVIKFLKEKNLQISQENINLLIDRCNGDRGFLKNELEKIALFSFKNKKISNNHLIKLTNLGENYKNSELVDASLSKNFKKTVRIINENNFNSEDYVIITRTYLNKAKKIFKLIKDYKLTKDINKTLSNAKPPIFWKDKDVVKKQILNWDLKNIQNLIFQINKIEKSIKKNSDNAVHIMSDFILQSSTKIN